MVEEEKWEEERKEKRQKSKKEERAFSFGIFSWLGPCTASTLSLSFSLSLPIALTHSLARSHALFLSLSLSIPPSLPLFSRRFHALCEIRRDMYTRECSDYLQKNGV